MNDHSDYEYQVTVIHRCPRCGNRKNCLDPECIGLEYEWCDDCRMKVTHYLQG